MSRPVNYAYALLSISLCGAQSVAATEQVFDAVNDAMITFNADVSNGAGADILVGNWIEDGPLGARRGLIQFDLSAVPDGAVITQARIELYVSDVAYPSPYQTAFALYRVLAPWSEGESATDEPWHGVSAVAGDVTWNYSNYDSTLWSAPGGDFAQGSSTGLVYPPGDTPGLYSTYDTLQVVADVQSWVDNPSGNFGWIILEDPFAPETTPLISSREHPTLPPPRLRVNWVVPAVEAGLSLVELENDLDRPVGLVNAGDGSGRLFIIELDGQIRIHLPDTGMLSTPFLDISERVYSPDDGGNGEQGLTGLAFHPDFQSNKQFYVRYTYSPGEALPTITRVARFSVLENVNEAGSTEVVILEIEQDDGTNLGGDLHFGTDGFLYIATGDGGGTNDEFGHAQDISSPKGKLLRIDVDESPDSVIPEPCAGLLVQDYRVPAQNPYVGPASGCDEVLHSGFRNPWRFSFDAATGDLWLSDIAQTKPGHAFNADGTWVDVNFGWSCFEGSSQFPDGNECLAPVPSPTVEIPGGAGHCAMIGGYAYRGANLSLQGRYVYGDRCSGRIWFTNKVGEIWVKDLWDEPNIIPTDLSSFGLDENCELYLVRRSVDGGSGALYRFEDSEMVLNSGFEKWDCR